MDHKIIPVPTRYRLYVTKHGSVISAEARNLPDRPEAWAVVWDGGVLRKDGEWEWEMQPSNRAETFIADTRYDSLDEAVAQFEKWLEAQSGV